jgi:HK97 family phage prohead protease
MTIEYRTVTGTESVALSEDDDNLITGLAIPFNRETVIGDLKYGGFREKVAPGSATKSIREGDVVALFNHDSSRPLGRMSAGNLGLESTDRGVEPSLHPSDVSYAKDLRTLVKDQVIRGWSFGFEVLKDEWTDDDGNPSTRYDGTNRVIREMRLVEVSPVTFPAYGMTDISARDSVEAAREGRAAKATYADLETCGECGATNQWGAFCTGCGEPMRSSKPGGDFCASCGSDISGSRSHTCSPENRADAKKPYGNVKYADAKNGKYPVDTAAHAKAAWSYINMPKNASKYPMNGVSLSSVKASIKAACKKFGIDISEKNEAALAAEWADGVIWTKITRDELEEAMNLFAEADTESLPEEVQNAIVLVSSAAGHAGNGDDTEPDDNGGDRSADNGAGETTPENDPADDALIADYHMALSRVIELGT